MAEFRRNQMKLTAMTAHVNTRSTQDRRFLTDELPVADAGVRGPEVVELCDAAILQDCTGLMDGAAVDANNGLVRGKHVARTCVAAFLGDCQSAQRDLVEESGDPCIDEQSDLQAWPATLERVLALGGDAAVYVPGHGAVVDAAFVRRQAAWLDGLGSHSDGH